MNTRLPALALLEYTGVATGLHAVDAMIKKAPIALLRCGTIHPGRFLALLGGTVAATQEAYREGSCQAGLFDSILLPDAHAAVHRALGGQVMKPGNEALGVLETCNSCAMLKLADFVVKSTPVDIVEMRLADDLHGNALLLITGSLPDVDAALNSGIATLRDPGLLRAKTLIPRLDINLADVLAGGTTFRNCTPHCPAGAELPEEIHVSG